MKHQRRCRSIVSLATTPISRQIFTLLLLSTQSIDRLTGAIRLYHNPLHLFLPHATCVRFSNQPLGIVTTTIGHITADHRYIPRQTWSTRLPTGVQPMSSLRALPSSQKRALLGNLSAQALAVHMAFLMPYPSRGSSTEGPVQ